MKNIYILLFLIPTIVFGQSWEKTFVNGAGLSVYQDNDGGYSITGYTLIDDNYDVYLIKTDENGDTLWTKTYGGIYNDIGNSVQQTTDGGYIITGFYGSNSIYNYNVYLIKTDEDGDTLWTKTYGENYNGVGHSVQQTIDRGYIIIGRYTSNGTDNDDVYLIKTDENGDTLWTRTYSGDLYSDCGRSVQQSSDGGYIITGYTFIPGYYSYYHLYLIKTDENGEILWTKTYKRNQNAHGYSVQQTSDGGYIITGDAFTSNSPNYSDVYLIKTDENGDTLWTKTYGGEFTDRGYSVLQNIDGGYTIAGMRGMDNNFNKVRVFVINTDSLGDTLWTKTYGVNDHNIGYQIKQTPDGGFIITGLTNDGYNDFVYLIKTNNEGNIVSTTEIPYTNPMRKLVKIVDFSGREIIKPRNNLPYIEIYNDGTTKKKMNIK